jgi:hypothetical protein
LSPLSFPVIAGKKAIEEKRRQVAALQNGTPPAKLGRVTQRGASS